MGISIKNQNRAKELGKSANIEMFKKYKFNVGDIVFVANLRNNIVTTSYYALWGSTYLCKLFPTKELANKYLDFFNGLSDILSDSIVEGFENEFAKFTELDECSMWK